MTATVPAARLREAAEIRIRVSLQTANAYAEALRSNRIDWFAAHTLITGVRAETISVCRALSDPFFDAIDEGLQIDASCTDFEQQIDALLDDLREHCLLNGPAARKFA